MNSISDEDLNRQSSTKPARGGWSDQNDLRRHFLYVILRKQFHHPGKGDQYHRRNLEHVYQGLHLSQRRERKKDLHIFGGIGGAQTWIISVEAIPLPGIGRDYPAGVNGTSWIFNADK